MRALEPTLHDYDLDLLRVIASRWDVELAARNARQAARDLATAMLDPDRAADVWARLGEDERGALQTLHASGGRMTVAQFTRLFKEIREMGPAKRKKEAPYLHPLGPAEALYYRGLIATAFDQDKKGVSVVYVYIPTDLRAALPFKTPVHAPETTEESIHAIFTGGEIEPASAPDDPLPVDDTAVDDVTTLLAYLQLHPVAGPLRGADQVYLRRFLLGAPERVRLALLLNLIVELELVEEDEKGVFKLARGPARTWMESARSEQARELALAWCESQAWNDLRHTPGLVFEGAGWQNDPLLARQALFHFLEMLSPDEWWSVDSFVAMVKDEAPDFQRPTGEWDSWYIRDEATGEYLRGFESWDRVDGALVRFMLTGPMCWLGLVQLDEESDAFRLTEAGLAALELAPWDESPDPPGATLAIAADGVATAPRAFNRYDRFTLARVTDWVGALDDGYVYCFSAASLRRARDEGIEVKHILGFLKRVSNGQVPESLVQAMQRWAEGGAPVVLSRAVVMQVGSAEELARLQNEPAINRYLGRKLADTIVEVQPGAWPELMRALQAFGVLPEVVGLEEVDREATEAET